MLFSSSIAACASALLITSASAALSTPSNLRSSITLMYQNNLNASDDYNHVSAVLVDPSTYAGASAACTALSENLISQATIQAHLSDFILQLNYQAYAGRVSAQQAYWINNAVVIASQNGTNFTYSTMAAYSGQLLPALCTQSATGNNGYAPASASNQVTVNAAGNSYVGYRNLKSFRFLGIQYAQQPARFTYSTVNNVTGQTLTATSYGAQCLQYGSGSENCLFLNIQTPFIPRASSSLSAASPSSSLRPVHFWIHGGGFTGGSGADQGTDGGNLASREDIVTVTINYRLSTLGFFAIPGTNITGNYGIGDQETALQWVVNNIAAFGGDPNRITINGESAGAGSVRVLLGSPPVIGKFQGAIAMSNLGGGRDLGLNGNYGTTYSSYYTIAQSYAVAGQAIFTAAGCTNSTLAAQIACLSTVNRDLTSFGTVARYVVQDGRIVNTPLLEVGSLNANVAHIPVIFGNVLNDGASFVGYSKTCTSELTCLQANLYISQANAQSVIDSGLFPYYDTGNVTADSFNVSQRITNDNTFRCVDQATVYAGATTGAFRTAYYYQMDRTEGGYNPNNVNANGVVTPGYPNGNPNTPYYRLHGSDEGYPFGNFYPLRDAGDLQHSQLTTAYFGSFIRSGNPNPPAGYLAARGYSYVTTATQTAGPWNQVSSATGPIMRLDAQSTLSPFLDLPQCSFLSYPIDYYLNPNAT